MTTFFASDSISIDLMHMSHAYNTLLNKTSQRGPWGAVVVDPWNVVHAM